MMRALQLTDPGVLELRKVPVPEIGPTDLLLRVGAAGICHSDLHVLHIPFKVREEPLTLGHEVAGTIEAVGGDVEGRVAGERGIVYLCWSCGVCRECVSGNENVCLAAGRTAMPPCPGLGPDGGMAEYIRIPASSFVPIGDLDFLQAAPLADAALSSYHAIDGARAQLRPGSVAVVIGIGGLGHVAVQYARAMGLRVVAIDIDDSKLALATRLGAEVAVNARTSDVVAEVQKATGGVHGVLVTAVHPQAFGQAIGLARRGGTIVFNGLPPGDFPAPIFDIVLKGLTIRGSIVGTRQDMAEALDFYARGLIHPTVESARLDDINEVFDRMERGQIDGRVVIDYR